MSDATSLSREIRRFVKGSSAGLLQLLVAAARRTTFDRIIACPTYPVPAKTSGLTVAVRQLREALLSPDVHAPTFLAQLYVSVRKIEYRKRVGQFFTFEDVADWALSIAPPRVGDEVCDAGAGAAVFAKAVLRTGVTVRSYVGVESDPILALCAAHSLQSINAPDSFKVWYANFLLLNDAAFNSQGLRVPTLIIANPPFVRYQNLTGRARIRTALKSSLGFMLSPLSGSGGYFLSRAAELTGSATFLRNGDKPEGRLLFFFPKEAAGAAHAQRLRDDLQRMHGWTYRQYEIPNAQTGIDRHASNSLALFFVFEQMKVRIEPSSPESSPRARVCDLIRIKRGISTGCNEFFVLTDEEARRREIPEGRLHAVLPTRISIGGSYFSESDWELLRASGRPCWLLTLPNLPIDEFEMPVQEYLKEGVRRGVHTTPTAQSLRTWFSIPTPPTTADVFVTYLFRGAPRFVLNGARVLHLTNILGGRFVSPMLDFKCQQMVIDSLNKQATRWISDGTFALREYRGGLRKIEPGELSMLPIDSALVELVKVKNQATRITNGSLFD